MEPDPLLDRLAAAGGDLPDADRAAGGSGLRIGEAIKLDRSDIDWANGVLLIRESKFGKSRLVPLHPSTMEALAELRRPARPPAATARRNRASSCP